LDKSFEPSLTLKMDSQLEEALSSLGTQNGVIGSLCADKNGLCLLAHGSAPPAAAGLLASLATRAKQLSKDKEDPVAVCLETESSTVLIRKEGDITLAIYKIPQQ
jgi:predicted regulator of Ras-like GTPase activity (Roadblock/LC7/MglB family)